MNLFEAIKCVGRNPEIQCVGKVKGFGEERVVVKNNGDWTKDFVFFMDNDGKANTPVFHYNFPALENIDFVLEVDWTKVKKGTYIWVSIVEILPRGSKGRYEQFSKYENGMIYTTHEGFDGTILEVPWDYAKFQMKGETI